MIEMHGDSWWRDYLQLAQDRRHALLTEVLLAVGFSPRVVAMMEAVPRHYFVPESIRWASYLNWTIPTFSDSALSAPGIVAYYLEQLPTDMSEDDEVIEIGAGTGYHASIVAVAHPDVSVTGFEAISNLASAGHALATAIASNVSIVPTAVSKHDLASWSKIKHIFQTTSSPVDLRPQLAACLSNTGSATLVRPLTAAEFLKKPQDHWLHSRFESFASYQVLGTSAWCVISTITPSETPAFSEVRALYGVTFVPWADQIRAERRTDSNVWLKELSTH